MHTIECVRTTDAEPAAVWRLLSDSATWPNWTPIDEYTPVSPANGDGLGEVRQFKNGRVKVKEKIVEIVPEKRLSYALLAGLAVRDYRADVDLKPLPGGGTEIRWHTTFKPKVPGMGGIYRRALEKATIEFAEGLAGRAARP